MIFFAVAGPMPGRSSSCFWVPLLRSTCPPAGAAGAVLPGFAGFAGAAEAMGAAGAAGAAAPPTVTIGASF